jgi:hypothetical protein
MYGRTQRMPGNTSASNTAYKQFWEQQQIIRDDLMRQQRNDDKAYIDYRTKERADNLTRDVREEQYNKESADFWKGKRLASKNPWKDFGSELTYGFKDAANTIGKPFLKYSAKAASFIPHPGAQAYSSAANSASGVMDKLI